MTISVSASHATTSPVPAAAPAATAAAAPDKASLNQNFDQFLLLLTTQLKNQDPLSPMDSTQFTNQLVSFSGVEQQIKTNENLTKFMAMQQAATNASQATLGLSYIGLNVDVTGNQFDYSGNGSVKTAYNLPADASINTINVLDSNGNTVYTTSGELQSGQHSFVWDGTDGNGQQLPPGTYTLQVAALDSARNSVTAVTTVPGYVSGIQTESDGSVDLIVGKLSTQRIPLASVTQASL